MRSPLYAFYVGRLTVFKADRFELAEAHSCQPSFSATACLVAVPYYLAVVWIFHEFRHELVLPRAKRLFRVFRYAFRFRLASSNARRVFLDYVGVADHCFVFLHVVFC